jgi:hypothetical protein
MTITRAQAEATMLKCRAGTTDYHAANDLHGECYGTIGALISLVDSLQGKLAQARLGVGGYQPLPGLEPSAPPPKRP